MLGKYSLHFNNSHHFEKRFNNKCTMLCTVLLRGYSNGISHRGCQHNSFKNHQVPLPHPVQRIFSIVFQEAIAILQARIVPEIGCFPHREPYNYQDCFL
jgi:hypothetical protein